MPADFDLLICGAGPAGTAAAITAARAGWKTALLERAAFPRHKVCGDCLNPSVWPVLESLGTADAIRALEHAALHKVRFLSVRGVPLELPLPPDAERAVTRESFDNVLLDAALKSGVTLLSGAPLTTLDPCQDGWRAATSGATLTSRVLIAADGRNSTACRLLGLTPPASRSARVALQCHAPLLPAYHGTVALEFLPQGYCGVAPVDARRMNLCLVSRPEHLAAARAEARRRYQLPEDPGWRSLAPLDRPDLPPAPLPGCFLAGDAARVVEPFTGEGIYYALRSGQLAADAAGQCLAGDPQAARHYQTFHRALYRHRLWVNRLSRLAVTRPAVGGSLLAAGRHFPALMQYLTAKVTAAA